MGVGRVWLDWGFLLEWSENTKRERRGITFGSVARNASCAWSRTNSTILGGSRKGLSRVSGVGISSEHDEDSQENTVFLLREVLVVMENAIEE